MKYAQLSLLSAALLMSACMDASQQQMVQQGAIGAAVGAGAGALLGKDDAAGKRNKKIATGAVVGGILGSQINRANQAPQYNQYPQNGYQQNYGGGYGY